MSRFSAPVAAFAISVALSAYASNSLADSSDSPVPSGTLTEVQVVAKRLNEARSTIQTQTGASTYTIDAAAIAATPGGENTLLNQVIMQAPEVAQDSFGQFHVRGEHNGLQYRINGIILPEGISVFGQSLDPRLISSMSLITGALPAEYGLRTAGIIDISTKSGAARPGRCASRCTAAATATVQPSFNYGGGSGSFSYFVSGDVLRSDLGIESPDGSSNPIHDHTTQYHGFGYFENILDEHNRLAADARQLRRQVPDPESATASSRRSGSTVNGQTHVPEPGSQ